MTPVYCDECGRANGATARTCIWCGLPMFNGGTAEDLRTTRVEIGYLDGIERFEDATPVRLIIGVDGVEVAELIPGTRSVKIPASSIIEATCADGSTMIESNLARPRSRWHAYWPGAHWFGGKKTPDLKAHDYILTIKYMVGADPRMAVFHREDSAGLAVIEGLARIVTSLVRQTAERERGGAEGRGEKRGRV